MDSVHVLLVEKDGRRTITLHSDTFSVLDLLRTYLKGQDAGIEDVDDLFETLHGPGYALSILTEECELPDTVNGRIAVEIVESEYGPAITVHSSVAAARSALAEYWDVEIKDLQEAAAERGAEIQIVTLPLSRD